MVVPARYGAVNFRFFDLRFPNFRAAEALFALRGQRDAVQQGDFVVFSHALQEVEQPERLRPEVHEGEVAHRRIHSEYPRAAYREQLPAFYPKGAFFYLRGL